MRFNKQSLFSITAAALILGACSSPPPPPPPPPASPPMPPQGSLTRNLEMVDEAGRHYGRVEMDPVGGGKVYDNSGRLIGSIHPPARD